MKKEAHDFYLDSFGEGIIWRVLEVLAFEAAGGFVEFLFHHAGLEFFRRIGIWTLLGFI